MTLYRVIAASGIWTCRYPDAVALWAWHEYHLGEVCRIEPFEDGDPA